MVYEWPFFLAVTGCSRDGFAVVRTRALELGEAAALAARLGEDFLMQTGLRSISLAVFYKLVDDARAAAPPTSN